MYEYRFPEGFLIGTANSAFQSEGAWGRDGASASMMEHFAKVYAGKPMPNNKKNVIITTDLADKGCFFYDNYEAYIDDMVKTGQNTFRMSLAWWRIIPTGYGEVNQKAIDHYNRVIDKLLEKGIEPFVDLNHWDVPQCLYEEGGAWRNPKFPEWFESYAKVCFEAFGDRVKLWSTFNEACVSINSGYNGGTFPPYETSRKGALLAGHNLILAHFRAVRLYKSMNLGGKIGVVHAIVPITPGSLSDEDIGAAQRMAMYRFDWYMQPMAEGRYPQKILEECPAFRDNMPEGYQADLDRWFTPMDFVGLNYYHHSRTRFNPDTELLANFVTNFYAIPGQKFAPYPAGILDSVMYVHRRYGMDMYITENGMGMEDTGSEETDCEDDGRISYLREHLRMICRATALGIPVKGYYYWNDADSYEQQSGFAHRFGMTWVDHRTGRRRWKKSRYYFSDVCKHRMVD